jgi:hypothetical protein
MKFAIGDRVLISDHWFVEEIRGWVGTIAEAPAGVADRRNVGVYWVEFPNLTSGLGRITTGAEVDEKALQVLKVP